MHAAGSEICHALEACARARTAAAALPAILEEAQRVLGARAN